MARNTYVAVYTTFAETGAAVTHLQNAGFDMTRLSVAGIAHGTERHVVGCYNTGSGLRYSGKSGAPWSTLSTPLSGWGAFWSPESGLVLVVGPLVQAIVSGQENNTSVSGMSDFGAGLAAIGIPRNNIVHYEKALMNNKFLLFVDGAIDDMDRAHQALIDTKPLNGTLHHGAECLT
jgi:hypothetical protein